MCCNTRVIAINVLNTHKSIGVPMIDKGTHTTVSITHTHTPLDPEPQT